MTDSYLAQMEVQIEKLLAHCDTLEAKSAQLQLQLDTANRAEQDRRDEYQQLLSQYDNLDQEFNTLIAKEQRARISEQQALHGKAKLVQLNDQTKAHIEKMIGRLKTLEQNA